MAGFRKAADRTLVGRSGPICNSLSVQLVGRLAQWLARLLYTQLVGGSSPSSPTTFFQRSTRRSPWRWPSANPPGPLPQCIPKLLVSAHEQLFSGYNADVRRYGKQRSNTAARSADVPVRSEVRPGQRAGIDPHRTASHRIAPLDTAPRPGKAHSVGVSPIADARAGAGTESSNARGLHRRCPAAAPAVKQFSSVFGRRASINSAAAPSPSAWQMPLAFCRRPPLVSARPTRPRRAKHPAARIDRRAWLPVPTNNSRTH